MTTLTLREIQVLLAFARTGSRSTAASELGISVDTVRNTLSVVHRKLGVRSSIQAVWLVLGERAA